MYSHVHTLARAQIVLAFSGLTPKSVEISIQSFSPYQCRVRIAARLRRGIPLSCEAILLIMFTRKGERVLRHGRGVAPLDCGVLT